MHTKVTSTCSTEDPGLLHRVHAGTPIVKSGLVFGMLSIFTITLLKRNCVSTYRYLDILFHNVTYPDIMMLLRIKTATLPGYSMKRRPPVNQDSNNMLHVPQAHPYRYRALVLLSFLT